jgi:uncharacterized repeat protein (TIGR04076 family)
MASETVRCTVESMHYSACGMVPGDYFEVTGDNLSLPDGQAFCYFAIASVVPYINGKRDPETGEDWLDSKPLLACPDPPEALYMRLERVGHPTNGELDRYSDDFDKDAS